MIFSVLKNKGHSLFLGVGEVSFILVSYMVEKDQSPEISDVIMDTHKKVRDR